MDDTRLEHDCTYVVTPDTPAAANAAALSWNSQIINCFTQN